MTNNPNKPSPTQKYLNIKLIRDGIIVLKDGRLRTIIKADPVNLDLKDNKEKEVAIFQYQNFLNSLKYPLEIVVQSRRVDLASYIEKVRQSSSSITNELLQKQTNDYLEFVQLLSEKINIMNKSFYVVISHVAKGAVEKQTLIDKILHRQTVDASDIPEKDFEEYKNILQERSRAVSGRLNSLGVTTKELTTKEIIELFYNTYNPEESYTQHLSDPELSNAPVIEKGLELLKQAQEQITSAKPEEDSSSSAVPKSTQGIEDLPVPQTTKKTSVNEILAKFGLNKEDDPTELIVKQGINSVLDIISPGGLNITPNYIQLGNFYVRTIFVYTYPRYLQSGWLSPIVNFDIIFDLGLYIYPIETPNLLGKLRRKTTQLQSSLQIEAEKGLVRNPELETAVGDVEELRDTLQKGETRLFQFGIYFSIYATTIEDLNKSAKQIETLLGGQLIYTKQAILQMEQGFNSTLPLADDQLDIIRNLDTSSLSTTFPFTSAELSHHEGILYGINLHNSSLILFDRFKMANANQVVFAKSGAGKSYAVKLEAIRSMMLGSEVIVIDPENEYRSLAEAVGGTYVNISLNSDQKINPFELPRFKVAGGETGEQILRSSINSTHGLIGLMAGGLSSEESNLLDKALYETYALKDITTDQASHSNTPPIFEDLVSVLRNMTGTDSLTNRLLKYTEGSFSSLFNSQTNIDMNNKFTAFSIRDMEDELRPIAMYLVLNYIWSRVKGELKKRLLLIDEGWIMMRHEDSAKFLNAIVKRARKYYLGVTVISQDVEDFLGFSKVSQNSNQVGATYGHSIVNNSSTQLILGQNVSAVDAIAQTFKLTDGEKYFLTEAEVGQGLFFAGNNRAAIQIVSSYTEDQIITTNPKQLLEIYGIGK